MRIIYNHVLDAYSQNLSASSEATNFGKELVLNPLLFKTWKSTGITSEWLLFDSGSGNTFDFNSCFISHHNFTSSVTARIQMNATNSWSSPSVDEVITYRDGHMVKFFTLASYRYCRFSFADTTNTDGYLQIGRISASQYLQITPSSLADFTINNHRNDITNISPSQNVYSYMLGNYRTFKYSFPKSSTTMIQSIRTMFNIVGNSIPILLLNYDTNYSVIEPCYCLIIGDIEEAWNGSKASYDLVLQEVGGF